MSKLSTREIVELAAQIISQSPAGIRFSDLKSQILAAHPETNPNTIQAQLARLSGNPPPGVTKPKRGVFAPAAHILGSQVSALTARQEPDARTSQGSARERQERETAAQTRIRSFLRELRVDSLANLRAYPAFLCELLTIHLGQQGKRLILDTDQVPSGFNVLAPDGIDDLPGPTAIRFAAIAGETPFTAADLRIIEYILNLRGIGSALWILNARRPAGYTELIAKQATNSRAKLRIGIWDEDDLVDVAQQYVDQLTLSVPALTEKSVEQIVQSSASAPADSWKQKRTEHILRLQTAFHSDNLVIFLGAGVSQEAEIPNWKTLLSRLQTRMIAGMLPSELNVTESEIGNLVELQQADQDSPLQAARYIRGGLRESFTAAVREALYAQVPAGAAAITPLLKAIARLSMPIRDGHGVLGLVTYNYDDLVERSLDGHGVRYRSISGATDVAGRGELPIYHVHGFLPSVATSIADREPFLVLSEERYHSLYEEPYSWSNVVQASYFREATVLMVGLSLTDPNQRRLLEVVYKQVGEARHFAIMKRSDSCPPSMRRDVAEAYNRGHLALQEAAYGELGVNVIWIEQYAEIPDLLDAIRKREGV